MLIKVDQRKKSALQPQCPQCKATGPKILVLSALAPGEVLSTEKGPQIDRDIPAVECLNCHALFAIGDLWDHPLAFFANIKLVV